MTARTQKIEAQIEAIRAARYGLRGTARIRVCKVLRNEIRRYHRATRRETRQALNSL